MDSAAPGPDQPEAASESPDAAAARARRDELAGRLNRIGLLALGSAETSQKLALDATRRDLARLDALPADTVAPTAESNAPTLGFSRAARVVRDCIALELRISTARKTELVGWLDRLGLLGMELAEATQPLVLRATARDQARMDATPLDAPVPRGESGGPTLSFSRACRVVRDCVAMELRITAPSAGRRKAEAGPRLGAAARKRLRGMKNEVRENVERSIRANVEPRFVDRTLFELDARLDHPEVEAEFGELTVGQMVLSVCRDLKVAPDLTGMSDKTLHAALAAATEGEWKDKTPPAHGRTIGLKADPSVEKLPPGVIGTPGVPPAMDVPPWPHAAPAPKPPDNGPLDGQAPPATPEVRRPPGVVFSR
jgi:hypothetical protein